MICTEFGLALACFSGHKRHTAFSPWKILINYIMNQYMVLYKCVLQELGYDGHTKLCVEMVEIK